MQVCIVPLFSIFGNGCHINVYHSHNITGGWKTLQMYGFAIIDIILDIRMFPIIIDILLYLRYL